MKDISDSEIKPYVIVCPPDKSSILKVLRQLKGNSFRWVYLGEEVSQFIITEQQIGEAGKRIEIGEKLQEIAKSLSQAYIEYIGKLSIANNSLNWWASALSEKSPLASKTFLYACYVKLCQAFVTSNGGENLLIVGENEAIRQGLITNMADSPRFVVQHIKAPLVELLRNIGNSIRITLLKQYLLALTIYRLLYARRYRLKPPIKKSRVENLTLLYNWVDARSLSADGDYRDNYFGELTQFLQNRDKNVAIVPRFSPTISYRQYLKKMARKLDSLLLPESFLTIVDVIKVFIKTLRKSPAFKKYPVFEGMDVSGIILNDFNKDWESNNITSTLLSYYLVKRWKNSGIPIDTFIYPYENQAWEKAYCLALREFYPSAKIIGYQHAPVPKMFLNYFFSKEEVPVLPFPDKVITTGKHTENLFKELGYNPVKVICGGAIRYASLLKKKNIPLKRDISNPVILVTPSTDRNETIELVWKVMKAFRNKQEYKIVFKFHPDYPYRFVAKGIGALPKHFIISDKPSSDLLQESHALIYTSSTTSIEAISLGVPVLHVQSSLTIDRDNLADFPPDARESANTPEEILKAVEKMLKMDEAELSRKRRLWSEIVEDMFGPVDESTFDLFL